MKTPEQIRDMEFQKSAMGGYKQSDVELFLEEVASQIEILMKQKAEAERKLQELSKNAPEVALSAASIQSVLVNAQKVAEQAIADANVNAEGIIAEANLKLTEADIKAREIIADAESKAVLLGETAETEAAKIIAGAVSEAQTIIAEAKESVELEQKLYDRMKIEISDFRKKAAAQCGALIELINQLPGEIPFNLERSKTVLSVDFSDPQELLKTAVDERLKKEQAEAEALAAQEAELAAAVTVTPTVEVAEPSITVAVEEAPKEEAPAEDEAAENSPSAVDVEFAASMQMTFDNEEPVKFVIEDDDDEADGEEEDNVPFAAAIAASDEPQKPKGRISFGEDDDEEDDDDEADDEEYDDDDDEDDEPRLFFRRKKK